MYDELVCSVYGITWAFFGMGEDKEISQSDQPIFRCFGIGVLYFALSCFTLESFNVRKIMLLDFYHCHLESQYSISGTSCFIFHIFIS